MPIEKAWRSAILHCTGNPKEVGVENAYEYYPDGLLITRDGHITALGPADELMPKLAPDAQLEVHPNGLLIPGFIDTHIHYPQSDMIASYGAQLLDWLNNYTFPEERKFADKDYASDVAARFLQELLKNGTTTALVFGTVHKVSVEAFFEQAEQRNLRMICGKVLMDRNAPDYLTDTPESGYQDSRELIEAWHHKGRLHYAVTPRFAPTSSSEQLTKAGQLLQEYEGLYLHTHLSENPKECEWVQALFPEADHYLGVYDQHQLLSERSVFAHGIHLCDDEHQRLHDSGSAIAFCPTSNLFLGSGLFNLTATQQYNINVGMGTDVGGGTSFSMWQTLSEAYKVMQLQGQSLDPISAFYLATLGGAKALRLEHKVGNLAVGTEADFVLLDQQATPLLTQRLARAQSLEERLFALMMLADDRAIEATYILGNKAYQRP